MQYFFAILSKGKKFCIEIEKKSNEVHNGLTRTRHADGITKLICFFFRCFTCIFGFGIVNVFAFQSLITTNSTSTRIDIFPDTNMD